LAYLVPIVRSGKTAIISTANKALQEQLFYKDIPFVQRSIQQFDAALVKGVGNYVCLDRLEEVRTGILDAAQGQEVRRVVDTIQDPSDTFDGDFETLPVQISSALRSRIGGDSDQCAWSKCQYFGECYIRRMRERAQQAQVIVVNHTLLLLDATTDGAILPGHEVTVVDEAHHLEEEATRAFTRKVSPSQIFTLMTQKLLRSYTPDEVQKDIATCATHLWQQLEQHTNTTKAATILLNKPVQEGLQLAVLLTELATTLQQQPPPYQSEKEEVLYTKLVQRIHHLAEKVHMVFAVEKPEEYVYYLERSAALGRHVPSIEAVAAPLNVAHRLKEKLFDKSTIICTSATLATVGPGRAKGEDKGPNFAYFRQRVGIERERPDVIERILPLTFDYPRHALLYVPRDIPAPVYDDEAAAQKYMLVIARNMYDLVRVSRGRAFLLFSSKKMLDQVYNELAPRLAYPLLRQGDMPRTQLVRRFRAERGAVLFGLKTFWEGVDIAGEALSLVVIDKLPFDPPDDPVHQARVAQMKANGEDWFGGYVLPQAVLRLKQGAGRLLRTNEDYGVMAILDTRLRSKGYGKNVLKDVKHFFRTH
jgi:ATP-dependent DNA helicase DinG